MGLANVVSDMGTTAVTHWQARLPWHLPPSMGLFLAAPFAEQDGDLLCEEPMDSPSVCTLRAGAAAPCKLEGRELSLVSLASTREQKRICHTFPQCHRGFPSFNLAVFISPSFTLTCLYLEKEVKCLYLLNW